MKCIVCTKGEGEYSDSPCSNCQDEIDKGNYFFILISDKSEKNKIRRLGETFLIDKEEAEKAVDINELKGEHIIFVREKEAKLLGLINEDKT